MPTILSFLSGRQITNDSGVPQSGAKLYHYRENTTTLLTVWQDDIATVAHANPVVCDSGGFVPLIYVDDTFDWKVVVKTSTDVTLKTYDNLVKATSSTVAATYSFAKFPWTQVSAASSPIVLTAADAGKAYEADTTGGNVEFDLPAAGSVANGTGFIFKKTAAANSMIIDPNGAETIDDSSTSLAITRQYQAVEILSNIAEWYVARQYLGDVDSRVSAASDTVAGKIEIAVQSEMETATSTVLAVTPGLQKHHPAHPKVWAQWDNNGVIAAIDFGASSVGDTGVGFVTITYDTAFSLPTYAIAGAAQRPSTDSGMVVSIRQGVAPSTTACDLATTLYNGAATDTDYGSASIIGDQ